MKRTPNQNGPPTENSVTVVKYKMRAKQKAASNTSASSSRIVLYIILVAANIQEAQNTPTINKKQFRTIMLWHSPISKAYVVTIKTANIVNKAGGY